MLLVRLALLVWLGLSVSCVRAGYPADADGSAGEAGPAPATWAALGPPANQVGSKVTKARYLRLAVSAAGQVFAAWTDDSNGNEEVYLRVWDGAAWRSLGTSGDPGGLSQSSTSSELGALVLDLAGRPYVLWVERDALNGIYKISCVRWSGSAWEALPAGLSAGENVYWPAAALDSVGRLVVAWMALEGGWWVIRVRRWSGSAWEALAGSAGSQGISGEGHADFPQVVTGAGETIHVAWQASNDAGKRLGLRHRVFDGTAWKDLGQLGDDHANFPSLVLDGSGRPCLGWDHEDPDEVSAACWSGSAWGALPASSAASQGTTGAAHFSLAVDAGRIFGAWDAVHPVAGRTIYARRWDGARWVSLGSDGTSAIAPGPHAAEYPHLVAAPSGLYLAGEEDLGDGARAVVVRRRPLP